MSRIRTVKPEFWTSEQVIACSLPARLLFIGLWNFCDDHGVHPASYVRLKAEVFPADSFTIDDIKQWIVEIISNDLLRAYEAEGKAYWLVTGWHRHQKIDKPTYRHPLPELNTQHVEERSVNVRVPLDDGSSSSSRIIAESLARESNGMESNGKDKDICEVKTSPIAVLNIPSLDAVQQVFQYWQEATTHPKAKLDNKRRKKIEQALEIGYSLEDLKLAVDGCVLTPFNQGQNDRNQKYDDIELILRDAPHIDHFISNAQSPPEGTDKESVVSSLMDGAL